VKIDHEPAFVGPRARQRTASRRATVARWWWCSALRDQPAGGTQGNQHRPDLGRIGVQTLSELDARDRATGRLDLPNQGGKFHPNPNIRPPWNTMKAPAHATMNWPITLTHIHLVPNS